ncbi:MAG: hypothetical protein AAGE52_06945 [Myxococcota bacterium]
MSRCCCILLFVATTANAQELGQELQERATNVLLEAGWRYPIAGQDRVLREDGRFPLTYHGAITLMAGQGRGFYTQARFDGFGPTGRGAYPFLVSGRVGYFLDVHQWDPGGFRQAQNRWTSRDCEQISDTLERCTTTRHTRTYSWWEPAGWVHGARYVYAAYRQLFNVEGDPRADGTETQTDAGAVGLGIGLIQSKFGTFLNEVEVHYNLFGWDAPGRSEWGFRYHSQVLFGPVFLDFELLLDAGLGSEISVGLGFVISP